MRIRTFMIIALVLVFVYAIAAALLGNVALLGEEFRLPGGASLPVGWAVFSAFVAGVAITWFVGLAREAGLMVERWRLRKTSRKAEEIEEEYSRGLVAVVEGREEAALRHFRAALERDSRHFNTLINLGDVLRTLGRHGEAVEFHRKAHHLKPDSTRPLFALVEDLEAKGDLDRARTVLGKIISIKKTSLAAWRKLRSLHEKERNWEQALEAQERVEKLSPREGPRAVADRRFGLGIRYQIASARLEEGRTREAVASFRRLIKDEPSFLPAHVGLGVALREAGQESEALRTWYQGFEVTGSPIFLSLLEEHHLDREQPMAAIEALKHCISHARKDTLPRFYLGKLYFRLEMLDDALAVLSSLEGRATYAPTLHYLLGRIHERRNNFRDSVQEYRKVIKDMDLVQLDYRCRACSETTMEWTDRCLACGEWNTVEVNFREEIPLEELGLAPAPIYTTRPS